MKIYKIQRVQSTESVEYLFKDVWIMPTNDKDVEYLEKIDQDDKTKKCCYWGGSKAKDL